MNISHELKDDVSVLLTITLTSDEIKEEVTERLKQLRKTAETPGFRPGKTPAGIIEKKYGQAIRFDLINKKISKGIAEYLKEQGIKTAGGSILEQDDNSYKPEQTDYELKVSAGMLPQFPTTIDSSVTLPHYSIQVDEAEIDEMITNAQKGYGERKEADDVEETDILYISVQELDDKGEHDSEGIALEETFLMPQYVTDEETRAEILKAHKGDTLTIDLHKAYEGNETEIASFLQIDKEEVKDHKQPFEIKVNRILRSTPHPLDEKLYKLMFGPETTVSNEEELRAELRKMLEGRNTDMSNSLFIATAVLYLLKQIKDLTFPDRHLSLLLNEKPEQDTEEEYAAKVDRLLPYLRYQHMLAQLNKQLDVQVSEELVRETLQSDIKQQLQSSGLSQLVSNEALIDGIVQRTIDDEGEAYFKAQQKATEIAFAHKVKELVTLDEQEPVSIDELYEVFEETQQEINELLDYSEDKGEEPTAETEEQPTEEA